MIDIDRLSPEHTEPHPPWSLDEPLRAPFPAFGGKSRAATLVWERFGQVVNYVEPFANSAAVLLACPEDLQPRVETLNDINCVGPDTRILMLDLTWRRAGDIRPGDRIVGFDEHNGDARPGLPAPTRYRRLANGLVTAVRIVRKRAYRLTFTDGTTVISSADHMWLGGSHRTGGRGWRWQKTEGLVCSRATQRSWVLKVADVVAREDTSDAGLVGGFLDGEGSVHAGPGLRITVAQNEGATLDRAESLLRERGLDVSRIGKRRCKHLRINGGLVACLSALMRFRPERLIRTLAARLPSLSLYGRSHRAVGLVGKEYLGEIDVVAIETDCHTFVAEGLASHNCFIANFWRATALDPDAVARWADWPVLEVDLHSRHRWLLRMAKLLRARLEADPSYYDARVAGWWVWGASAWIGTGWCEEGVKPSLKIPDCGGKGIHGLGMRAPSAQLPDLGGTHNERGTYANHGKGVHARGTREPSRQLPILSGGGDGVASPGRGLHGTSMRSPSTRLPDLSGGTQWGTDEPNARAGRGIHSERARGPSRQLPALGGGGASNQSLKALSARTRLYDIFAALSARLRYTRVACGDWARICTPAVTYRHGLTAVFLDPPYDGYEHVYGAAKGDEPLSAKVRAWALENGARDDMRIALRGYEGEHDALEAAGWEVVSWKAKGGYSNQRTDGENVNKHRERIWFSPACLRPGARAAREAPRHDDLPLFAGRSP